MARQILTNWPEAAKQFVQVIPTDYKLVLDTAQKEKGEAAQGRDDMWTAPPMLPHTSEDNRQPSRPELTG